MLRDFKSGLAAAASGVVLIAAFGLPAHAADMPLKAAVAPSDQSSGFYAWADGTVQWVPLPRFAIGWHGISLAGVDTGVAESHDPIADGAGVAGAIGYRVPDGRLPPFFGTNIRVEFGASYVSARTDQSSGSTSGSPQYLPLLNGTVALPCAPPFTTSCATSSQLSTRFDAWHLNGKFGGDHRLGYVVLSPSVSIFSGGSRSNQKFTQEVVFLDNPTISSLYTADVALNWNDFGAKLGLDTRTDITPWLAIGLGGSIGVASRTVMLVASDSNLPVGGFAPAVSTIGETRFVSPFVGNAEASVLMQPWTNVTLKGVLGLNFDNMVPGISTPSASLFQNLPPAMPARIKFEAETSYYAGGGVAVKF